ncbi:hypothetical protein [Falsiroseomonas sp. CW058]|uniref:hypothetical protein n=1 Tax=Falsiroseomonas sp. CW058 TaxID=3388664 RepID=UPI003D310F95
MRRDAGDPCDGREVIAFEETVGLTPAGIYAAIEAEPDSPLPSLCARHVEVTGVRGVLRAGGAEIPIAGMDLILPWPVRPRR